MNSKEMLVAAVKAAGKMMVEDAENLVGDTKRLTSMDIWVHIRDGYVPELEATRYYAPDISEAVAKEANKKPMKHA